MAYTQKYGRGNLAKTGNGLESTNLVNPTDPPSGKNPMYTNSILGIQANTNTAEWSSKPYEKSIKRVSKNNSVATVYDGAGKPLISSSNPTIAAKITKDFVRDSTDTMDRRNKNAIAINGGIAAGINKDIVRVK